MDDEITDATDKEEAMKDTVDAIEPIAEVPPRDHAPRCDCPALSVPHTHEQGGPEPLDA